MVGVPASCTISFDWLVWSLPGAALEEGVLNASDGMADVRLTALAGAVGPLDVHVLETSQAPVPLDHGHHHGPGPRPSSIPSPPRAAFGDPFPGPVAPGDLVAVGWNLSGGVGPYEVDVEFGDGTNATLGQGGPGIRDGSSTVPAGEFAPEVRVSDSRASRVGWSDPMPLMSVSTLAVSLAPSSARRRSTGRPSVNGSVEGGGRIDRVHLDPERDQRGLADPRHARASVHADQARGADHRPERRRQRRGERAAPRRSP